MELHPIDLSGSSEWGAHVKDRLHVMMIKRILQYQELIRPTHFVSIVQHSPDVIERESQRETTQNEKDQRIKTQKSTDEITNAPSVR